MGIKIKKCEQGFTVIELLVSFVIVMTIALGLFAIVDHYRERQQAESAKREIDSYRNEIIKTVHDDAIMNRLIKIEPSQDTDCDQSILLVFASSTKRLCVKNNTGSDQSYIQYGDIKYEVPSPFVRFINDIIYYEADGTKTELYPDKTVYSAGYKMQVSPRIYAINIRLEHTELKDEFRISMLFPVQEIQSQEACFTMDEAGIITKYDFAKCPTTTIHVPSTLYDQLVEGIAYDAFKMEYPNAQDNIEILFSPELDQYLTASSTIQSTEILSIVGNEGRVGVNMNYGDYKNVATPTIAHLDLGSLEITSLPDRIFESMKIEKITLPKNLTTIGDYALASNKLKTIIIPDSVTSIGKGAFALNTDLESVEISSFSFLRKIDSYAFIKTKLVSVTLPKLAEAGIALNAFPTQVNIHYFSES